MSELMFGVVRGKLSKREVARRDRICREEGGTGFTYVDLPGTGLQGWFTGPNLGAPFDADLRNRVMARVAGK